jgi:type IV pilus assembly protein PilY1
MNMGGKEVTVTDAAFTGGSKTFISSYVALDVTDPSQPPTLLWEKSYSGLGFTTNLPCVVKVKNKWFLAMGNGPTDYDYTSTNPGRVFLVDVKTGDLVRTFPSGLETSESNAFMNSPVSLDKNMNYSVAGIYTGESFFSGSPAEWKGKVYKIAVPQINNGEYDAASYDDNPANWKWMPMLDLEGLPHSAPITASLTVSVDNKDNVWLFMGTGRFMTNADKSDTSQNYIMGVKDPFFNLRGTQSGDANEPDCYHSYTASGCTITLDDLFDSSPYTVLASGTIDTESSDQLKGKKFDDYLNQGVLKKDNQGLEMHQGWYRKLVTSIGNPAERVVNKPAAFGGIVLFPAFTPSTDQCLSGGSSRLYAMYFESGTAYKKPVLKNADNSSTIQFSVDLGAGLASSTAIHAGREAGQSGKVISQLSTGQIVAIDVIPAVAVKSGMQYWREGR